jgi:chemotaxis protein CheY-P-specific phosphatase CheC
VTSPDPGQLAQHGAHEAAAALSRMLRVPCTADSFATLDPQALARSHAGPVVVIAFDTTGGVEGTLAVVADDGVAAWLAGRLTGKGDVDVGPGVLAVLAELGNIAASAFLNGTARLVKRACLPSVPRVDHVSSRAALAAALPGGAMPVATLVADGHAFHLAFGPRGA